MFWRANRARQNVGERRRGNGFSHDLAAVNPGGGACRRRSANRVLHEVKTFAKRPLWMAGVFFLLYIIHFQFIFKIAIYLLQMSSRLHCLPLVPSCYYLCPYVYIKRRPNHQMRLLSLKLNCRYVLKQFQ